MSDLKLIGLALIAAGQVLAGVATASIPKGGEAKTETKTPKAKDVEPEPEDHGIEYQTVSDLVVRVSKELGRDAAVDFLKTFKNPADGKPAKKGAEISPADYPRAVEAATKLLDDAAADVS